MSPIILHDDTEESKNTHSRVKFYAIHMHVYTTLCIYNTSSFARYTLALLLAAIGGSDMSLQYIFEIYVHSYAPIRSTRRMDCQSDIYKLGATYDVRGDDPSI